MSDGVFSKLTKPSQCVWVMGLPVTKDDFYASQLKSTAEYTKRFWHWPEYCRELINDYAPLKEMLIGLGVKIIENASVEEFSEVWLHDINAVVLFTHWMEDGVEFRDGKVKSLDIAKVIPSTISATLDLCVCHPIELITTLEFTHPNLIKKCIWEPADPKYWFMFYSALFRYLANGDKSYPDAIDIITSSFLKGKTSQGETY